MTRGQVSRKRLRRHLANPDELGRNDPCLCGSQVKYKRCCLPKGVSPPRPASEVPPEVLEAHNRTQAERRLLESQGIYIDFPNTITLKGKSFLAVGNQLLWIPQPDLSFHQLIIWNLTMTLGKEWWATESAKPEAKRHFMRRCLDEMKANPPGEEQDFQQVTDKLRTFQATGHMQSIISVAFDVYLLAHKSFMPDDWMRRLSDRNEYQGVRYEIAIASLFVRIGCNLEFYPAENPKRRRAEFIAHHPETGVRVAVEAKSRQRPGILNAKGEADLRKAMRGDIHGLFNKALKKETDDLSFLIFIDVNAPTETGVSTKDSQWFKDVQKMFDSLETPTAAKPQSHNALIITNYSFHYDGNDVTRGGSFSFVYGQYPRYPIAGGLDGVFMSKILQATGGYGYVPPNLSGEYRKAAP